MPAQLLSPAQKEQQRLNKEVARQTKGSVPSRNAATPAEALLGVSRGPSGNPSAVDASSLRFGTNLLGGGSTEERDIVRQFLGGLSGGQERTLQGIRAGAGGGGLFGGAVEAQVGQARTEFLAQNRVSALPRLSDLINRRVASLRTATAGFLQNTGALQTVTGGGLFSRVATRGAAGEDASLAALRALEAVGLGNVGRAGLAQAGGAFLAGNGPLSEEEQALAGAARTYFDPLSSDYERAVLQQYDAAGRTGRPRNLTTTQLLVAGRARNLVAGAQTRGTPSTAAEQLVSAVQGRLSQATGAAAEIQGAIPAFQALFRGGQSGTIAGADTSRFQQLFRQLGIF